MSIFIRMTDTFMSGWGQAEGKNNTFVVECDTEAQAQQIERHARERSEMKRVKRVAHCPKNTGAVLVSRKHYSDLGGVWIGE